MSFTYEKSKTWRWIVASSRASTRVFVAFAGLCVVMPWAMGHAIKWATDRNTENLQRDLLRSGREDSLAIARVNKERLEQLLREIERKDSIEDRYAAALRGETLTGPPDARVRGGGGTTLRPLPAHKASLPLNSDTATAAEASTATAASTSG
ncbi:hypothetical protein O6H91_09G097700 [Diphasiastrum complanatum]|uniref:Uncharacterized protein n=1 Tax=Diphasiastrum complanatum TaxID=34168 RepID=A0ACC2CSF1_DIPCM|nr:hypothetical protein O6H91_09G097700 [Diphasiastrum complanatum]